MQRRRSKKAVTQTASALAALYGEDTARDAYRTYAQTKAADPDAVRAADVAKNVLSQSAPRRRQSVAGGGPTTGGSPAAAPAQADAADPFLSLPPMPAIVPPPPSGGAYRVCHKSLGAHLALASARRNQALLTVNQPLASSRRPGGRGELRVARV